jgi:hypothetical protein
MCDESNVDAGTPSGEAFSPFAMNFASTSGMN